MEKMNFDLKESPVVFNQEHHTYDLNGHELSGVTPIIAWLFPDTYKGIPQSVLDAAADYGTLIHEKCELLDSMGIVDKDCNQVKQYANLIANAGLTVVLAASSGDSGRRSLFFLGEFMDFHRQPCYNIISIAAYI